MVASPLAMVESPVTKALGDLLALRVRRRERLLHLWTRVTDLPVLVNIRLRMARLVLKLGRRGRQMIPVLGPI